MEYRKMHSLWMCRSSGQVTDKLTKHCGTNTSLDTFEGGMPDGNTLEFSKSFGNIQKLKSSVEDRIVFTRAQANRNVPKCFTLPHGTNRALMKYKIDGSIEHIHIQNKYFRGCASANMRTEFRANVGKSINCINHASKSSILPRSISREKQQRWSRNNFSCHEKALKDAGYEANIRHADNQKTNLENNKVHESLSSAELMLPSTGKITLEANLVLQNDSEINTADSFSVVTTKSEINSTLKMKTEVKVKENMQIQVPIPSDVQSEEHINTRTINPLQEDIKKIRPETAKFDQIECKPLMMYLKYVCENQEEYLQYAQSSRPLAHEYSCSSSLIKLGQAFEMRNHGGKMKEFVEDVTVMAVKALRPRTADFENIYKQKNTEIKMRELSSSKVKTLTDDKRHQSKNTPAATATTTIKDDEHSKTELEKRKLKAEDWCRTVSTNTFIRAKIQCLRELGSNDLEITNWFEAFKNCHYIRKTSF